MQTANIKTPDQRVFEVAHHLARSLSKFPKDKVLVGLLATLAPLLIAFKQSREAYLASILFLVDMRVDVKFADLNTDTWIKNLIRRAEIAETELSVPLVKDLAPDGVTPLVKPYGQAQVDVLKELETVLASVEFQKKWPSVPATATEPAKPGAPEELAAIIVVRKEYEDVLKERSAAWDNTRKLRKLRNLAKDAYVTAYGSAANTIKALFPKDKKRQEFFFDKIDDDVEKEVGDEDADTQTSGGAPPAAPAGGTSSPAGPAPAGGNAPPV